MPKVSQEHMDRRRQQILSAAKECFAKEGFHNTSMQDIFKASGLSAGAVYRYFPSKHSLIKAMTEETLGAMATAVSMSGPDVADLVSDIVGRLLDGGPFAELRPIVVQVWAEAFRDPEMAAIVHDVLSQFAEQIRQVLPEQTPPEVARLILAIAQGFLFQAGVFDDVTPELVRTAARAAFG